MSILFVRCALTYTKVHFENDVFEQIDPEFSAEFAAGKTKDIIFSLSTSEGCFSFVFERLKKKLIDLRKEFVDKWDIVIQSNTLCKSHVDVTDIEEHCKDSSELVLSINKLIPLAQMVDKTSRVHLGDRLSGNDATLFEGMPTDNTRKKEMVLTFLRHARKLISINRGDIQDAGLQAISAMIFACEYGKEGHSAVARVIQAELYSFLKSIITADEKFTNALLHVHKIGVAKTHTLSGLLHDGWWGGGEISVATQVIEPTVFIALLGGNRLQDFDKAFNIALKGIIGD